MAKCYIYVRRSYCLKRQVLYFGGHSLAFTGRCLEREHLLELFFSPLNKVSVLEAKVNTFMTSSQLSCAPSLCPNSQVCKCIQDG